MGLTINGGLTITVETKPKRTKASEDTPQPTEVTEVVEDPTPKKARKKFVPLIG